MAVDPPADGPFTPDNTEALLGELAGLLTRYGFDGAVCVLFCRQQFAVCSAGELNARGPILEAHRAVSAFLEKECHTARPPAPAGLH